MSNRKWIRCGTNIQYFECPPNIATEYSTIHYGNAPTPVAPEATSTKQNATSGNGKKKKKSKKEEAPQNGTYVSTASSNNANAYCLSFTHTFDRTGDVCYIAFSLPYTYTDLQKYLYNVRNTRVHVASVFLMHICVCSSSQLFGIIAAH